METLIELNSFWNSEANENIGEKKASLDWNAVDFDIIGDQFKLKKTSLIFDNNLSFNIYPFFKDINDFSFNNKSGIFLTDLKNNNDVLEEKKPPEVKENLKSIKSVVFDFLGNPLKHYYIYNGLSGLESRNENYTINNELTFYFEDSYVYVEDAYGRILTNSGFGQDQTTLDLKRGQPLDYQKWDYILGDNTILLFSHNTNYSEILTVIKKFSDLPPRLQLQKFEPSKDTPIPTESFLYLKSYNKKNRQYESVADSYTIKYITNPRLNTNNSNLIKRNDTGYYAQDNSDAGFVNAGFVFQVIPYYQNYLAIFPYEYEKENKKYDFYFHGLKNYQNTEYEYTLPEYRRIYHRINTGTNQNKGNENIYLTYQVKTIPIKFKPDTKTQFYISPTSQILDLNSSKLFERGAFAGNTPKTSDKIFTKRDIDLYEIKEISNVLQPPFSKNNKYLCSWLYADTNLWMDRYYDPDFYTLDQALSTTHLLYNSKTNHIFDIVSEIKLQPGVPYEYHHIGNNDCMNNLNDLNYSFSSSGVKYCNVLNITSWNARILTDNTPYNNYGLTIGNEFNFYDKYWALDGTNHAVFQANDSLLPTDQFTVSLWLNFKDWSNINAYQIFGNFYNSGFGLINDTQNLASLISVINKNDQTIYNFNSFLTESSKAITKSNDPKFIVKLPDLSYYIVDDIEMSFTRYDVNNSLIGREVLSNLGQIDQVELDSEQNVYFYDNEQKLASIYSSSTRTFLGNITLNENSNRLEIGLNDQIMGTNDNPTVYGDCSVIDNNNSLWQVVGPNLYKDFNLIGTVGYSNQITCDRYNNIWILSNDDSYTKYNQNENRFEFRYYFNQIPLLGETNCPESPKPPLMPFIPYKEEDLPFLATSSLLYILTFPDYDLILVTPPPPKPLPNVPFEKIKRVLNFVTLPLLKEDVENKDFNICGQSLKVLDRPVIVDWNVNQIYILNQEGQLVSKLNLESLVENTQNAQFKTEGDFTGYQYFRKYKNNNGTVFSWKFATGDDETLEIKELEYNVNDFTEDWHHFCFVFNLGANISQYYVDGALVTSKQVTSPIYYKHRTSLLLGATSIENSTLNDILNLKDGYKMIGNVADLKIYDIPLNGDDVKQLYYGSIFSPKIKNVNWEMDVGYRNYTEEVNKWFTFQLPTNKSKYFNINIHNLNVDNGIKTIIENALKNIITDITPAHTILNKVKWDL